MTPFEEVRMESGDQWLEPKGVDTERRWILALAAAIVVCIAASCVVGSTPITWQRALSAIAGAPEPGDAIVLWEIRLPRALAALVVGVALGGSGAAMQGLLRNPLAEPGVLGVTASAAFFATCSIHFGLAEAIPFALPLFAVMGAMLATAVLAAVATRSRSSLTLTLTGVGLSSFAMAAISLIMNVSSNPFSLADMVSWMLGSVANRSMDDVALALPIVLIGCATLWWARHGLSLLTLGEEAALGAGLNVRRQHMLVVIGAGLATGGAVSLAGAIGFVGIVAPHLVRPLVRHDAGKTLVPAALLGGAIMVLADLFVRVLPTNSELKLGVVASLIGAPMFVWVAMHRDGSNE